MSFVSPGAYGREIDLSLYVETESNTAVGLVGLFNKGPINTPGGTLVSNLGRLIELYGEPIDPSVDATAAQAWFAAREILRHTNKLYIERVESAAQPAEYAAQSLQGGTDETLETGTDGATSIPATREFTSAASTFITNGVVAGDILEINDGTSTGDNGFYVIASVDLETQVTVSRDFPTGSLTGLDFTIHVAVRYSGATGVTSVTSARTFTDTGTSFNAVVRAGDILLINDTSTTDDNGVYVVESVDSATQLTVNRDWPAGSLTALSYIVYGHSSIGTDGSTAVDGEFSSAAAKFQDHGVKAGDILYIYDAVDTGDNGYYMITGLKTGSEDTTVEVNEVEWATGSLTGLSYEILPGSITFQGLTKGTWCKDYQIKALPNSVSTEDFNLQVKDSSGRINLEDVTGLDRSNVTTEMSSRSAVFSAIVRTLRTEPAIGKTFTVSGGDDGNNSVVDSDFLGSVALESGIQAFKNKEKVEIDIGLVPGQTSQNIQDALIDLAEIKRKDFIALVDSPDFPTIDTVQEIINYHNGTLIRTTALNTSYAALYWTWASVYDEFHDLDVYTAPSGHMAGVFCQNDNQQAPWFAPAGLKRGKLRGAKELRMALDQDDRDALYGDNSGNNVNPLVNFIGLGIHAWGQKTLQRATTALNRINVRRMLLSVKRAIEKAARNLVFDPNDEILWREFKQLTDPVLRDVLSKRGINEYLVVADETTTTPAIQDQNRMVGKIFIKPTKAAEIIEVQFILTSQTADFQEIV